MTLKKIDSFNFVKFNKNTGKIFIKYIDIIEVPNSKNNYLYKTELKNIDKTTNVVYVVELKEYVTSVEKLYNKKFKDVDNKELEKTLDKNLSKKIKKVSPSSLPKKVVFVSSNIYEAFNFVKHLKNKF